VSGHHVLEVVGVVFRYELSTVTARVIQVVIVRSNRGLTKGAIKYLVLTGLQDTGVLAPSRATVEYRIET
jgi:hypothetical protein